MHSPEPWKAAPYTGPVPAFRMFSVTTDNGEFVCATGGENADTAFGNLERIVACVNACRGIPTECLETIANTVRSALDAGNAIYAELANGKLAVTECNSTPPAWRAKYRTEPTADVESRYNLPPGTLK